MMSPVARCRTSCRRTKPRLWHGFRPRCDPGLNARRWARRAAGGGQEDDLDIIFGPCSERDLCRWSLNLSSVLERQHVVTISSNGPANGSALKCCT